ncbi:hypothetical protein [Sulfurospirillum sp. MES]|uniref:hypothetical protein n=1 Tax=Sulfurospirillum TaxID=57665 RepID=UPI0005427C80|nr:hypothetical protein [Sulfurospirillum sp. MES]KHG33553.1 MAG: hypothetical protein OA34_09575 [Sulfurospirillum sp. MES]
MKYLDTEYRETKRIKRDNIKLNAPFQELSDWIESFYKVKVLNIIYDHLIHNNHCPRLQVILETEEDCDTFNDKELRLNFSEEKQKNIFDKFIQIVQRDNLNKYQDERLFVCFAAFEPTAREDANEKIKDSEIENLKSKLADDHLWQIRRMFGSVTFFFFTNKQVEEAKSQGLLITYSKEYLNLIKQYDEFGYLNENNFSVIFDSQENFETNYQGNWFYYDR